MRCRRQLHYYIDKVVVELRGMRCRRQLHAATLQRGKVMGHERRRQGMTIFPSGGDAVTRARFRQIHAHDEVGVNSETCAAVGNCTYYITKVVVEL